MKSLHTTRSVSSFTFALVFVGIGLTTSPAQSQEDVTRYLFFAPEDYFVFDLQWEDGWTLGRYHCGGFNDDEDWENQTPYDEYGPARIAPRENDHAYIYAGVLDWPQRIDGGGSVTASAASDPVFMLADSNDDLIVGYTGTGRLSILDGAIVASNPNVELASGIPQPNVYLGYGQASSGEVLISGTGSTWELQNNLFAGVTGSGEITVERGGTLSGKNLYLGSGREDWYGGGVGTLTIQDGGTASTQYAVLGDVYATSHGTAVVRGNGSTWTNDGALYVGKEGKGTLEIYDRGRVTAGSSTYIGYGRTGSITVDGKGSTFDNQNWFTYVGYESGGSLKISNGGTAVVFHPRLGYMTSSAGNVTVEGADSTLSCSNGMTVGFGGGGTFDVLEGGRATCEGLITLGLSSQAKGIATVSGEGSSLMMNDELHVGTRGDGQLTIADGGLVSTPGALWLAKEHGSKGAVRLEGGTLTVGSIQQGEGSSSFQWTGGMLKITDGDVEIGSTHLLGNRLDLKARQTLDVAGNVDVNYQATLSSQGGTLSANTLDINGTAFFSQGSTLSVNALNVNGTAKLQDGQTLVHDSVAVDYFGRLSVIGQTLTVTNSVSTYSVMALEDATLYASSLAIGTGEPDGEMHLDSGLICLDGTLINKHLLQMGASGPATVRAANLLNYGTILGSGHIQAPVDNRGRIETSGDTNFSGKVTNRQGSKLIIGGRTNATFFEDVENQMGSEMFIPESSTATFFGDLSGVIAIGGKGTSYIERYLRPGLSPGTMSFAGDVVLDSEATLQIEIAGDDPGEHDLLDVDGLLTLGGTLQIEFIDGFVPQNGDTFEFLRYGLLGGNFREYEVLGSPSGMDIDFQFTERGMAFTMVPEPSSALLILSAVVGVFTLGWIRTQGCRCRLVGVSTISFLILAVSSTMASAAMISTTNPATDGPITIDGQVTGDEWSGVNPLGFISPETDDGVLYANPPEAASTNALWFSALPGQVGGLPIPLPRPVMTMMFASLARTEPFGFNELIAEVNIPVDPVASLPIPLPYPETIALQVRTAGPDVPGGCTYTLDVDGDGFSDVSANEWGVLASLGITQAKNLPIAMSCPDDKNVLLLEVEVPLNIDLWTHPEHGALAPDGASGILSPESTMWSVDFANDNGLSPLCRGTTVFTASAQTTITSGVASVPEPSTVVLLVLGGLTMCCWRT